MLVPPRDPAAVTAIRAYAAATPNAALAAELVEWANTIDPQPDKRKIKDVAAHRVAVWAGALAAAVRSGDMEIETALQRIAGHALSMKTRRKR